MPSKHETTVPSGRTFVSALSSNEELKRGFEELCKRCGGVLIWEYRPYLLLRYEPMRNAICTEAVKSQVRARQQQEESDGHMLRVEHDWCVRLKISDSDELMVASVTPDEWLEGICPTSIPVGIFNFEHNLKMARQAHKEFKMKWKHAPSVDQPGYKYHESLIGFKGFFKTPRALVTFYWHIFDLFLNKESPSVLNAELMRLSKYKEPCVDKLIEKLLLFVDPCCAGSDWLETQGHLDDRRKLRKRGLVIGSKRERARKLHDQMAPIFFGVKA